MLLRETGHCIRLRIIDIEKGYQPRNLQQLVELRSQMAKPQRCSAQFCGGIRRNQSAETRAVNQRDIVHVKDQLLLTLGDEALNRVSQSFGLLPEYYAPVKPHHSHPIHFSAGNP